MWSTITISLLVTLASLSLAQVYVDYGYPYDGGEFSIGQRIFSPTLPGLNPPPMHTKAYFPEQEGLYAVNYFITGFDGILPPELYDTVLGMMASHGYVVFSNWVLVGEDGPVTDTETHWELIQWLKENTEGRLGNASASFDHLGFSCHSAGCGTTLRLMNNDTDLAKASVNIEPVSGAIIVTDVDHFVPSINFGAELANNSCSFTGVDFETFHRKSNCPKIMFEGKNASHCDILDDAAWTGCDVLQFCETTDDSLLDEYRTFVQGFTVAFMTAYIQGNMDQLEYVTDPSLMPWELLQHQVELECQE